MFRAAFAILLFLLPSAGSHYSQAREELAAPKIMDVSAKIKSSIGVVFPYSFFL